jgi:predicted GNAT superfamily acetyltransferase
MSVRDHVPTLSHDGIVYRRFDWGRDDHGEVLDLQAHIWSRDAATPVHQLIAAESCGGLLIGAFDEAGAECVGFCYAFPAYAGGRGWLHSHQTGLREEHRNKGAGEVLKWLQRTVARAGGHDRITWTFDPLQARNAYFNLAKLGVVVDDYKVDYYGKIVDRQNPGIASDRLWVEWRLDDAVVLRRFAAFRATRNLTWPDAGHPPVDGLEDVTVAEPSVDRSADLLGFARSSAGAPEPVADQRALDEETVRIATPRSLESVRAGGGASAVASWRARQREAFLAALGHAFEVTAFAADPAEPVGWYVLTRR